MCDLMSDVITCRVWSSDKGKINASDKIIIIWQPEKGENVELKDIFYTNVHLRDRLDIEFTAC